MRVTKTFTALAASAALVVLAAGNATAELTVKANHDHITVDFFYHGSSVSVRGVCDPDADLIIKIAAADGLEVLKEKGKMAGVLWMNVGTLEFEKTPKLYEIYSTKPSRELLTPEEADRYVLGYSALARHVEINPPATAEKRKQLFGDYLKFKEASKLYARTTGQITFAEKDGKHTYAINTPWPYQAAPGEYVATVYAVKGGKVVETVESKVVVEQVGTVRYLASLAKNHGALYGLLSIAMALGAGFGVGLIFRKGGGAH
ncbi:MAG: TIGR02186 family protein [Candidatus Geothermincolia bacterium]